MWFIRIYKLPAIGFKTLFRVGENSFLGLLGPKDPCLLLFGRLCKVDMQKYWFQCQTYISLVHCIKDLTFYRCLRFLPFQPRVWFHVLSFEFPFSVGSLELEHEVGVEEHHVEVFLEILYGGTASFSF